MLVIEAPDEELLILRDPLPVLEDPRYLAFYTVKEMHHCQLHHGHDKLVRSKVEGLDG